MLAIPWHRFAELSYVAMTGTRGGATVAGGGSWCLRSESAKSLDGWRELSAWDVLPAVKDQRFHLLVGDEFVVPDARGIDATRRLTGAAVEVEHVEQDQRRRVAFARQERRQHERPCGRGCPAPGSCAWLQRGCGVRGWGRDGLGTGAQGRGARARRALMSTMRRTCGQNRRVHPGLVRPRWAGHRLSMTCSAVPMPALAVERLERRLPCSLGS